MPRKPRKPLNRLEIQGLYTYNYCMETEALQDGQVDQEIGLDAPRSAWVNRGACTLEPEAWSGDITDSNKCKEVCAKCPVIDQCLRYALANNEKHLVWGGMTPKERQAYLQTRPNLDRIPIEYRDQYTELEGRVKRGPKASILPPRNPALDFEIDQSFLDLIDSIDVSLPLPTQEKSLTVVPNSPIVQRTSALDAMQDLAS